MTKPVSSILNRAQSDAEAKGVMGKHSSFLKELVDYGTGVFMRCQTNEVTVDLVKTLWSRGADVDAARETPSETALELASLRGHLSILGFL